MLIHLIALVAYSLGAAALLDKAVEHLLDLINMLTIAIKAVIR